VEGWRETLIEALALLEAALDFSDEGDVTGPLEVDARAAVATVRDEVQAHLAQGIRGERLREGFTVVIAGPPNAGKSTLLNAIARRDVAIVSPVPGTTRDSIEVRCDLDGLPVTFVDTAGLRDSTDAVEQEGIARARARAERADLVLLLQAPDVPDASDASVVDGAGPVLTVATKRDIGVPSPNVDAAVSAHTGEGVPGLLARVAALASATVGQGDAVLTRERHRRALERAAAALGRLRDDTATELAAEDVRLALRALGEITGRVDVEDVLDRLFATFCIGK
jgi:tRNA modification GTPase